MQIVYKPLIPMESKGPDTEQTDPKAQYEYI